MKKSFLAVTICLLLLSGCGTIDDSIDQDPESLVIDGDESTQVESEQKSLYWYSVGGTYKSHESVQEGKGSIETWLIDSFKDKDDEYEVKIYSAQPLVNYCGIAFGVACGYQVIEIPTGTLLYEELQNPSGPIPVAILNEESVVTSFVFADSCGGQSEYAVYNFKSGESEKVLLKYTRNTEFDIKEIEFEGKKYFLDDLSDNLLVIYEVTGEYVDAEDCGTVDVFYDNLVEIDSLEQSGELVVDSGRYDGIYFSKGEVSYQFSTSVDEIIAIE